MAQKTEDRFEAIRQKSVSNIKETALKLFAKLGYHSTSISRIAKEAGISKGLMYNYFKSKKALLQDIIYEAIEENEKMMTAGFNPDDPAIDQLKKILFATVELVKNNLEHWKLLSALAFQPDVMEEFAPIIQEKQEAFMAMGIEIFSKLEVEDPTKEVLLFGAILDGMFFHYMSFPEAYPIDEMKVYLLKKYEPK